MEYDEVFIKNGKEEVAVRMFMTRDDWNERKQGIII